MKRKVTSWKGHQEQEHITNEYLQCTEKLWEEKGFRLQKGLKDVIMRAGEVDPAPLRNPSNFLSKSADVPIEQVFKTWCYERKRLETEIVQNELSLRQNYYIYMFF